ncbi:MAG: hypothetical protein FWH03_01185 [Firmicutes bacterium]|nr:hypothetical protein [Bacillota bacterium]
MGFGDSGGIKEVTKEDELPKRPSEPRDPNTRYDYYQNGKLKTSTWTNADGWPIKSRHYNDHGYPAKHPKVPHDHDWGWVDGEWTIFDEWY